MNLNHSLLEIIPSLENLKLHPDLAINDIEDNLIKAMANEMVLNYQEVLSVYADIDENIILQFDKNTTLAFLTAVIRMERFVEGTLPHNIRSGLVLKAIKHLSDLVGTNTN